MACFIFPVPFCATLYILINKDSMFWDHHHHLVLWPEVVAVRTEGQYSPVRLELARLVSSLLYGTRFLVVLVAKFEFVGFAPNPKYAN